MSDERMKAIAERVERASPGPWHYDSVRCGGSYGDGPDAPEGFDAYQVLTYVDGNWRAVVDTLNSDLTIVHEECEEDGRNAWDETGRKNAIFIAEARSDIPYLLSLLASREAREWQPIETAPKDGTLILVAIAGTDFNPAIVFWAPSPGGKLTWALHYNDEQWLGAEPTHWMPLPEPPTLRAKGGRNG